MTDRLNADALEAAAKAARVNWSSYSDWDRTREATRNAYRDLARAAVSAYLAALPAPRTITTVEDAEKLPNMSVLIDADGAAFQRSWFDLRGPRWSCLGDTFPTEEITFPAMVLWVPTEGGGE